MCTYAAGNTNKDLDRRKTFEEILIYSLAELLIIQKLSNLHMVLVGDEMTHTVTVLQR